MIAWKDAWRTGLLRPPHIVNNIVAGVVVGVVALPLAMAFAIASGAKPEQGIYTSIVSGVVVSIFGGSRIQIAGPTGAFIVILAAITARYGVSGLELATLMAGLMLIGMSVARMGAVIKFIPAPVIVGFTAGIGVIIWVGQWGAFFGLPPVAGIHFRETFPRLVAVLPQLHPATTALSVAALVLVTATPRIPGLRRIPGPLVALVVITALQHVFQFTGVATIGTAFGGIPSGLPHLVVPDVSVARVAELIGPAFTIALLGAIESLLSAVVADGMAGTRHNSNQELFGQGLANVIVPFFGGFAATGAIARTATNVRNGGDSPLAGIVHAITLILIILLFAPLASSVPLGTLAAVLFVVAYNMSDLRHFRRLIRRAPAADIAILLITFSLTVFADLVVAINIGVILAILHFVMRMASAVEVNPLTEVDIAREIGGIGFKPLPTDILVFGIEGPFFFGAVEQFERALENTGTIPRVLILRLRHVPFIDFTGIETLDEVVRSLVKRGVQVILCEANARVLGKLERARIPRLLGAKNCAQTFAQAIDDIRRTTGGPAATTPTAAAN